MWWDHIVRSSFTEACKFHMSRSTFFQLKHDIIKNDTVMQKAIPVEYSCHDTVVYADFHTIGYCQSRKMRAR